MKTKNISCIPVFIQCGTGVESNLSFQDDGELFYSKKLMKPDGINSNQYLYLVRKAEIKTGEYMYDEDTETSGLPSVYINVSKDTYYGAGYFKVEATTNPSLIANGVPAISNLTEFVKLYNEVGKMPEVLIEMENTSWGFQQMSNKGIGSTIIPDVFKVKTNSKNEVKIIFK